MREPVGDIDAAVGRVRGDPERRLADLEAICDLASHRVDDHQFLALWRGDVGELAARCHRDPGRLPADGDLRNRLHIGKRYNAERIAGLVRDECLTNRLRRVGIGRDDNGDACQHRRHR